jgi:hypothetical protein
MAPGPGRAEAITAAQGRLTGKFRGWTGSALALTLRVALRP